MWRPDLTGLGYTSVPTPPTSPASLALLAGVNSRRSKALCREFTQLIDIAVQVDNEGGPIGVDRDPTGKEISPVTPMC